MSRNYTRRCKDHDYYGPFIYHIILSKAEGCPDFGVLTGSARIPPGERGCAEIRLSQLGKHIKNAIELWQKEFPFMEVWKHKVMPDHIHLLVNKNKTTPRHLSFFIGVLKATVRKYHNSVSGNNYTTTQIFKENYCDRPLFRERNLNTWFSYIDVNPHRLAMRLQYPEFFTRIRSLIIGGMEVEAYGNMFLLRNPDKQEVHIRRLWTQAKVEAMQNFWVEEALQGAVIVSPFISEKEKEVRDRIIKQGGKMIWIQYEEFGEKYKPAETAFKLCEEGRLLIISLKQSYRGELSRELCVRMNNLAEEICKHS